jgi:hypothetical protein
MVKQNATVRSSAARCLENEVVVLDEQLLAPETPLFADRTELTRSSGDMEIHAILEADQKRLWALSESRRLGDFFLTALICIHVFQLPILSTIDGCESCSSLFHSNAF